MQRVNSEEILDSAQCPPSEARASLRDLRRINRWFGGVGTTRKLIEQVSEAVCQKHFTLLEVGAGLGEVPQTAGVQLADRGIRLEITDLDRFPSHLRSDHRTVAADALSLPFRENSFDLVSCNLLAHHLEPAEFGRFVDEAWRVCRQAVLINDLVRHPLHLALVYAAFPLMRSHVSRVDGVASVRRAYVPEEMRRMLSNGHLPPRKISISRHYLFRMGVIIWKESPEQRH